MEEEFIKYLVCASENLLLENGQIADQNAVKKLQDLVMVQLHSQYLKDLEYLHYCVSLKICILSRNFLTNIDALECCINLIKLDLHSNQIEDLPGAVFWRRMKDLSLLYLHDNGISKLENVHLLSFCPNLIALTLFNTPLSLKIAYRHIVINSIFSLKALDYYVISDEEIMEDQRLPEKYRPFTPPFFVDFSPPPVKESTFQEEMKMVREIISKINHVLAHYSPVLIAQKCIRGYLIRKKLCLVPFREVLQHKHYFGDGTKRIGIQLTPFAYDGTSAMYHIIKPEQHTEVERRTSGIQGINIKELHSYLRRLKQPALSTTLKLEEKKKVKQKEFKRSPREDFLDWKTSEVKEDEMATKFRLSGYKMPFYSETDELREYLEKEREFFEAAHDMRYVVHPVPPKMPVHDPGSIEKRVFARAYGCVRLRPLCAIDKAYSESKRWDIHLRNEREVLRMLIARSEAKNYILRLQEERTDDILKKHEDEAWVFHNFVKEWKEKRSKLIGKMKQRYAKFLEGKERRVSEQTLVQGFSTQHTSLTRGLLRLDGWRKCQERISEKQFIVKATVQEHKQQKEMLKHFHEQRQQLFQKQSTAEKKFRKCMANEMAKERVEHAKVKVAAVKEPRLKIMYTLPVIGSSATAIPLEEYNGL